MLTASRMNGVRVELGVTCESDAGAMRSILPVTRKGTDANDEVGIECGERVHRVFLVGFGLKQGDREDGLHLGLLAPVVIELALGDGTEPVLRDIEADRAGYL